MRSPVRALAVILPALVIVAVAWFYLGRNGRDGATPVPPAPGISSTLPAAEPDAAPQTTPTPPDAPRSAPTRSQAQSAPAAKLTATPGAAPGMPSEPTPANGRPTATPQPKPDPRVQNSPDGKTIITIPFNLSRQLHAPNARPEDDLGILTEIFRYYRKIHGEHPVAHGNRQIIDALAGDNPRAIVLFDPGHPDRNPDGELLDRYGNPYFFHAISATEADIVSAGPDGVRGSLDDIHSNPDAGAELKLRAEPAID